jgi:hypothetical protein
MFHHHHFILFPCALFIVFVIEIVYIVLAFHFNLLHITFKFKHISILEISYIFYVLQFFVKKHFLTMLNDKNDGNKPMMHYCQFNCPPTPRSLEPNILCLWHEEW